MFNLKYINITQETNYNLQFSCGLELSKLQHKNKKKK